MAKGWSKTPPEAGAEPKKIGRPPKTPPEVVEAVENLLADRQHKGAIKRELYAKYAIKHWTADRLVTRARKHMVERTGRPLAEHRVDALEFYERIVRDQGATWRERILAQERKDKLLGLEVHTLHLEHSGKIGLENDPEIQKRAAAIIGRSFCKGNGDGAFQSGPGGTGEGGLPALAGEG